MSCHSPNSSVTFTHVSFPCLFKMRWESEKYFFDHTQIFWALIKWFHYQGDILWALETTTLDGDLVLLWIWRCLKTDGDGELFIFHIRRHVSGQVRIPQTTWNKNTCQSKRPKLSWILDRTLLKRCHIYHFPDTCGPSGFSCQHILVKVQNNTRSWWEVLILRVNCDKYPIDMEIF